MCNKSKFMLFILNSKFYLMDVSNLNNGDFFINVDETPTVTPTMSVTPTVTPTNTPTISVTSTITPTSSVTPTITPTNTTTPSVTPTSPIITLFEDCSNNSNKVRFSSFDLFFNTNEVYEINGGGFNFFGKVKPYSNVGNLYSSNSISFIGPYSVCPSFCISSVNDVVKTFNGNYKSGGTFNSNIYYTGDTQGVVYFNGVEWCLSGELNGDCVIKSASPCDLVRPKFNSRLSYTGYCVTPTPSASVVSAIDFDVLFQCDILYSPTPSVTPTKTPTNTPTITPTKTSQNTGVIFSINGYEPIITATPSATVTQSTPNDLQILGAVTFNVLENIFTKDSYVNKLIDCNGAEVFFSANDLYYNSTPISIGDIVKLLINGDSYCLLFLGNEKGSPNVFVEQILGVYSSCEDCTPQKQSIVKIIEPTVPISPTPTPTPSLTRNLVFVFESCRPTVGNILNTRLIQTKPYGIYLNPNQYVKDESSICWRFVGYYPNTYISYGDFIDYTYNGNYFSNVSSIYENCENCLNG